MIELADFGEAIDVRFARAKIAALDRVVEKPVNAVAVVRVIFRGVDSALGGDAVGAARAVLITERFDVVTLLPQRRRGRAAGQTGADDDDLEFAAIVRRDQPRIVLVPPPFFRQRAMRNLGIERADHGCGVQFDRGREGLRPGWRCNRRKAARRKFVRRARAAARASDYSSLATGKSSTIHGSDAERAGTSRGCKSLRRADSEKPRTIMEYTS